MRVTTDDLVVGVGASGLAFTDALVAETRSSRSSVSSEPPTA
jgi:hypothetical protein